MTLKKTLFSLVLVLSVLLIFSCVSLNPSSIERGRLFYFVHGVDPRFVRTIEKLSEEHGLLINLASDDFVISRGNEVCPSNSFLILPPGTHTINWRYEDSRARYVHGRSYLQGSGSLTLDLEAGQYYYFEATVLMNTVSFNIYNLQETEMVTVRSGNNAERIPSASVIEGMHASIRRWTGLEYPN